MLSDMKEATLPVAMICCGLTEKLPVLFINAAFLACLGYEREEDFTADCGGFLAHAVPVEERVAACRELRSQLEKRCGSFDLTCRVRAKNGGYIWMRGQGVVRRADNGRRCIAAYCIDVTADKERENQLHLYRKASSGGAFVVRMDEDFTLLYGNDIYYRIHEYTPESMLEHIGNRCREYVHPDDLPSVRRVIGEAMQAGKTSVEWEMRVITGQKNIRRVLASGAFEYHDGIPLMAGFVLDKTENYRRAEEQGLRDAWYRIALSQTTTNVWEYDLESRCILLNESSERQHGYREKVENVPESLIESGYIHPESHEDFRNLYRRLHAGEPRAEADIRTRTLDGRGWWWEHIVYTLRHDAVGGQVRAVAVGEDVTRQKEAERRYHRESRIRTALSEEIRYRERLFDALSSDADKIYVLFGKEKQNFLQYVSPNLERLLGIRPRDLEEGPDALLKCVSDPEEAARWKNALESWDTNGVCRCEVRLRHAAGGRELWMHTEARRLSLGDSGGMLLILSDRTREREQQERLAAALRAAESANRAKSRFLSSMSHDIRTPMNGIIGMTTIARQHLRDPERLDDCLKKISLSSRHLLGLLNDVLDMSKIESGKFTLLQEPFTLAALMGGAITVIQPQIQAKGQRFSVEVFDIRHEALTGDVVRLNQVLLNILGNAVKFTPEGGAVSVSITEREAAAADHAAFRFVVRDTGIGMSPEFRARIFEPFSQEHTDTRNGGTGLGMAITKNIMDVMGGVLRVDSAPGKGTVFILELEFSIRETPPRTYALPPLGVLVVRESAETRVQTAARLREMGAHPVSAANGGQALRLAEERGVPFDAAIVDRSLADMSGLEAIRRLRRRMKDGVLLLAVCDGAAAWEEARAAGATDCISLPLFRETLYEKLRPSRPAEPTAPPDDAPCRGRRILLVEDNELNQEIARELLRDHGADVVSALDGREALDMFAASPEDSFDAVLMDIQMPVMNGYEATQRIRSLDRPDAARVPIIALTADAFREDIESARQAGMDGHVAKPFDWKPLLDTLEKAWGKKTADLR